MNTPIPLPTTSSEISPELGGGSFGQPPDRFSDHAATTTERFLELRWQDNKSGKWSKLKQVSLKTTGGTYLVWWNKPMGQYRSRQYELIISDPVLFVVSFMEEVLEVLNG